VPAPTRSRWTIPGNFRALSDAPPPPKPAKQPLDKSQKRTYDLIQAVTFRLRGRAWAGRERAQDRPPALGEANGPGSRPRLPRAPPGRRVADRHPRPGRPALAGPALQTRRSAHGRDGPGRRGEKTRAPGPLTAASPAAVTSDPEGNAHLDAYHHTPGRAKARATSVLLSPIAFRLPTTDQRPHPIRDNPPLIP
jgi:hypothetical protein